MDTTEIEDAAGIVARLFALPEEALLAVWGELTAKMSETVLAEPTSLVPRSDGGSSIDGRLDALMGDRRHLERAADIAHRVARSADAVTHVLAAEHHDVARRHDVLSGEALGERSTGEARGYDVEAGEFAASLLGGALGLTAPAARAMAAGGAALRARHPELLAASARGDSSVRVAAMLAGELAHLEPDAARRVEHMLVASGDHRRAHQAARERCRTTLRQLGLARPVDVVEANEARGVWFTPHLDFEQLCTMTAVLDTYDATAIRAVLEERARQLQENSAPGARLLVGAARADALADLILENSVVTAMLNLHVPIVEGAPRTGFRPEAAEPAARDRPGSSYTGQAPESVRCADGYQRYLLHAGGPPEPAERATRRERGLLHVEPSPDTSEAADGRRGSLRIGRRFEPDESRAAPSGGSVASFGEPSATPTNGATVHRVTSSVTMGACGVPGVGVIDAGVVARLASLAGTGFTATFESHDARGRVTTLATTTAAYRPTLGIAKLVRERDGVCRFPFCEAPVSRCDLDHVVPFDEGGPTTATNLQALCRHHHRAKTHGGFRITMTPDGVCAWRSPSGARWITEPGGATRHVAEPVRAA